MIHVANLIYTKAVSLTKATYSDQLSMNPERILKLGDNDSVQEVLHTKVDHNQKQHTLKIKQLKI